MVTVPPKVNGTKSLFKLDVEMIRFVAFAGVVIIAQFLTVKMHMADSYMHVDESEYLAIKQIEKQGFPYDKNEKTMLHDAAKRLDRLEHQFGLYESQGRFQTPQEKMLLFHEMLTNHHLLKPENE